MSLTALLDNAFRRHADRIAIDDGRRRFTYRELDRRTRRFGHALLGLGLRPGDAIATVQHNSIEMVEFDLAAARFGAGPHAAERPRPGHRPHLLPGVRPRQGSGLRSGVWPSTSTACARCCRACGTTSPSAVPTPAPIPAPTPDWGARLRRSPGTGLRLAPARRPGARRRAQPVLHLGHHRPAEGRGAVAPQLGEHRHRATCSTPSPLPPTRTRRCWPAPLSHATGSLVLPHLARGARLYVVGPLRPGTHPGAVRPRTHHRQLHGARP